MGFHFATIFAIMRVKGSLNRLGSKFLSFRKAVVSMKYVVLLCDGMADYPVDELGGKTPMQAAVKPHMDALAQRGTVGLVKTVADGLTPGSDVANLSVMGYDPLVCYTGRSPLEAASMGIALSDTDLALRCNLVTLSDEPNYAEKTMVDYCAGDISSEEAAVLIQAVQEAFGSSTFSFYPGVSYRHCLVWHGCDADLGTLTPPHDISGRVTGPYLTQNEQAAVLLDMMKKSYDLLSAHPVNQKRVSEGKRPANSIWLWGQGKKPRLERFSDKFGLKGAVVSAVDLIKGIGTCAEMTVLDVPGATGYIDTNFEGKADAALRALSDGHDFVYIHVEAPDECGHRHEIRNKVRAIEMIDSRILSHLLEGLEPYENYRIMILPDHPTPLATRTHASDPVPFLLYEKQKPVDGPSAFDEQSAAASGLIIAEGCRLMSLFTSK